MKRGLSIFVFVILTSCGRNPPLRFEQLSFPSSDEKHIKDSLVETLYQVIQNNYSEFKRGDTIGTIVYDNNGRILEDRMNKFSSYRYEYDSVGRPKAFTYRDWDLYFDYKVTYRFISDSLILYKINKCNEKGYEHQYVEFFKFNHLGQIVEMHPKGRDEEDIDFSLQEDIAYKRGFGNRAKHHFVKRIIKYRYNEQGDLLEEIQVDYWSDLTERKKSYTIIHIINWTQYCLLSIGTDMMTRRIMIPVALEAKLLLMTR